MGDDIYFMEEALKQAKKAYKAEEVPVGAVIVADGEIVARTHNRVQGLQQATAHAELLAFYQAFKSLHTKYLLDCTLYVTLEPCVMCAGALAWAQLGKLVYGASDDKQGFMRFGKTLLHPKTKVEYGILQEKCSELMRSFFREKRK